MKRNVNAKMALNIIEMAIGGVLAALSAIGKIGDIYLGFGLSLVFCGALLFVRSCFYKTNEAYREKVDIEISDERNRYIRLRGWSWAGYLFVMLNAVGTVVFMVAGNDLAMQTCGFNFCAVILLYIASCAVISRRS